tara:strand:+ start:49 stop:639 length:591 start_codon:yes stop_codon:yes gene_type:complete
MSESIKIPLFPLNLVLLPNEELSLHIFEKKYKHMVSDCIEKNSSFGIILRNKNYNNYIGCTARIIDVLYEYDTGEYDIIVRGEDRFSLIDTKLKHDLLLGNAIILPEKKNETYDELLSNVRNKYLNILLNHKLTKDIDLEIERRVSYDFTKKIILPNKLKQFFLEQNNEKERLEFLDDLFNKVILESNLKNKYDIN